MRKPYPFGLHWSLPFPLAERYLVRVKEKKVLELDSFWFKVADQDKAKLVSEMGVRGGGLEPGVDGSLMTGDKNLKSVAQLAVNFIDYAQDKQGGGWRKTVAVKMDPKHLLAAADYLRSQMATCD